MTSYEVSNAIQMNSGSVYNTSRDNDDRLLHYFHYQSEPMDHSIINMACNSNLKKSDE